MGKKNSDKYRAFYSRLKEKAYRREELRKWCTKLALGAENLKKCTVHTQVVNNSFFHDFQL